MLASFHNLHSISLSNALQSTLQHSFCLRNNKTINRAELLADAVNLSQQLPEKEYALNLCNDRYLFIVAYLAVCIRHQVSLLPQNKATATIQELSERYPNSYMISDNDPLADFYLTDSLLTKKSDSRFPEIDIDRTLSISFTSGSTGEPKAISKTWREFQVSAELALQRFNLKDRTAQIISTAPMQHMFGLETSFFWVLFSHLTLYNDCPFYPEDIRAAINATSTKKILISTPRHLNICSQHSGQWSAIQFILSSTAPLSSTLAKQIENTLQSPVFEVFGSTETLSFASRQTSQSEQWQLYNSIQLKQKEGKFILQGGHIKQAQQLDDQFTLYPNGYFSLLGRHSDLIKIAGKRASLSALNDNLNKIEGIEDAVFFSSRNERLSAIVVSQLAKHEITDALRLLIDEVFLPRTVYYTSAIPRNSMGKLIKTELDQLIQIQQRARN